MKVLRLLAAGLRRAARHPGLVVLLWAASLLPALLATSLASPPLEEALDRSPFAGRILAGDPLPVLIELGGREGATFGVFGDALPLRFLLVVLLQIVLAAGLVEVLLERSPRGGRPLLAGIGRHGWAFARSALWFWGTAALVVGGTVFLGGIAMGVAFESDNVGLAYPLVLGLAAVALLVFVPLDCAYDLARISAASHGPCEGVGADGRRRVLPGDRRTFVGFFRALAFTLRHPLLLVPLYLAWGLLLAGLHVGGLALRSAVPIDQAWKIAAFLAAQQLLFLLHAFLRVGFWGSEVALYQGFGEPRWCGKGPARG